MPKLKLEPEDLKRFGKEFEIPYKSVAEISNYRPWHSVEYRGTYVADFFNDAATEVAIRLINADTSHAGGVRIRFSPGATYANLVKVFDILNYTNHKRYWLDIHHKPTTLYALTILPVHTKQALMFSCGTSSHEVYMVQEASVLQQLITDFKGLISFKNQAWRLPVLLLIMMGNLSLWQLFHRVVSRHNS